VSSYWLDDPAEQLQTPRADGQVDVAIVGGGVTGCSCALTLARGGLRVRVHDARAIASGASGRNGGFALRGGALQYHTARDQLGAEPAQALWRLTERYLDRMAELAGDTLRRTGSLRLAADEDERGELRTEHEALREDDLAAEWIEDLAPPLDRLYHGAIRHPTDGALHPARWVRRLATLAAGAGVQMAEHHRVESLDELDAEHVVLATDGYTQGLVAELDRVITPTRGQVIATEPLERRLFDCPHYARRGFDYWQQTDDDRLILGGRRDVRLQEEETGNETITEPIQDALEQFAAELVGEPPQIVARWAGIFGTTADRLPLAGLVPGHDGLWVAAGYSGHGNVLGFACGDLVAGAILGLPPPELALFDPSRLL
jgi:gamma-glutamylputrescine oxidase